MLPTVRIPGHLLGITGTLSLLAETLETICADYCSCRAGFQHVLFTDGIKAVTPNGVLGNPHGMSSELGFACLNG
ncbi:hypothetical protein ACFVAQ_43355, partial [Streptomyces sp. NPDC057651]|uniref:hypothetical protein n=1 Tax=Streptomyces sp. NPDC057651 TaxID=3346194 RepID=UPI0036AAAB78